MTSPDISSGNSFTGARYDTIGKGYNARRRADPRIAARVTSALGVGDSVLNIGAGTGSYEPSDRQVFALEPSAVMISQRDAAAAPVVQGVAEQLPFPDNSFDAAMGLLTLHHWADWQSGLTEAMRVARQRVVIFTWVGYTNDFWLTDYFPEIGPISSEGFPAQQDLEAMMGEFECEKVSVPYDCQDGFLCSYWRRPAAYLDPQVRQAISTFARIDDQKSRLASLKSDLETGAWAQKYAYLLDAETMDYGYRLMIFEKAGWRA
ncbi:MAG: class I SAM-dependent methyltransferase [Halioglobus sp.]